MTEHKKPVVIAVVQGQLQCNVVSIPDWEGFDKLVQFLQKYYQAVVLEKADGPDARVCRMDVGGEGLELQFEDPWGNTLVASTPSADELLRRIADDLRTRLKSMVSP